MNVKVIMGLKGSGKTKHLIELIHTALEVEHGNVVCIERSPALTFEIPSGVRLISASDYAVSGPEFLKGFISGLYASNYDITHIFIDGLYRIAPFAGDVRAVENFLTWLEFFGGENNIKFTVLISADVAGATDAIKKYF